MLLQAQNIKQKERQRFFRLEDDANLLSSFFFFSVVLLSFEVNCSQVNCTMAYTELTLLIYILTLSF